MLTYIFELLFCFISPSYIAFPFAAGGDDGLAEPLNRRLGGEGTIFRRSCGGTVVLPGCAKGLFCWLGVPASELAELVLELPPTLKEALPFFGCVNRAPSSGLVLLALEGLDPVCSLDVSRVLLERLTSLPKSVRSPLKEEYGVLTRVPSA